MKFTVSTKPLNDALALGVINANISNFHMKSTIAQVTLGRSDLKINLEAADMCSELRLKGSGDSEDSETIFVSCLLLKQLVSTFESSTTTLEITPDGLVLKSGSSRIVLPKLIDEADMELSAPQVYDNHSESPAQSLPLDKDNWKFIKDSQMYAIAMSFEYPAYAYVWVGADHNVIVGDMVNELFTCSAKGVLPDTCLISSTIINLFNSLPEGAALEKIGDRYIVTASTDGFSYITQFTPKYESDPDIGSYNSEILLNTMIHPDVGPSISTAAVSKLLNQDIIVSGKTDDVITVEVSGSDLLIYDDRVEGKFELKVDCPSFKLMFNTSKLSKVISSYGSDTISIHPMIRDGEAVGLAFWNGELTTILSGVQ